MASRAAKFIVFSLFLILFFTSILPLNSSLGTSESSNISGTRQGSFDKTEASEWVKTTLDITFEDPIRFTIIASFEIHEVFLPEYAGSGQMTADGIRKQYSIEIEDNPVNPPIKIALNQKANNIFDRILNHSFQGSMYLLENPLLDISSLNYPVDANLYDPPVKITQYCSFLELTENTYFSAIELNRYKLNNFEDLIEGTLKMGATVKQNVKLFASAGHVNTYRFNVKEYNGGSIFRSSTNSRQGPKLEHDQLKIDHPDSDIAPTDKSMVSFTMDNTKGLSYITKNIIGLELYAEQPNSLTDEMINIVYNFDLVDFNTLNINKSTVTINSIKLDQLKKDLPSNFTNLEFLSADGIRLFYKNGIINLTRLDAELKAELDRISNEFEDVLDTNLPVNLGISWNYDSIANLTPLYHLDDTNTFYRMGSERAVVGYLSSTETIKLNPITNTSTELIRGLLNAGATAKLDFAIKSKYDYKYNLTLPSGASLFGHEPLRFTNDGRYKYLLTPFQLKNIIIQSVTAPVYSVSRASIDVDIDLHEVEILSFTEYKGHIRITARGSLNHLEMESNSRFSNALPKEMRMEYFNSDAIRLIYTEELLNFSEIEDEMYLVIKENITKLLDEDVKMRVDFDRERLEFDGNVDTMDNVKPIQFKIEASGKMPISENRLVKMGALITKQIQLPISGVENWNVTYNFILPQYIEIIGNAWVSETKAEYDGPRIEQTLDDRYELSITIVGNQPLVLNPDSDSDSNTDSDTASDSLELEIEVNIDIEITLWFFLNKIIMPIVLLTVLIILIIIIYVLRRRKYKKLIKIKEELGITIDDDDILGFGETENGFSHDYWSPTSSTRRKKGLFADKFKGMNFPPTKRSAQNNSADQEDYSARLRELVPEKSESKTTKKVRKRAGKTKGKHKSTKKGAVTKRSNKKR